jgi:TonB family protein
MAYHFAQSEILPRRTLAAFGIILLHLFVIYLLATALMHSLVTPAPPALVARFIPQPTPAVAPPPSVPAPNLRERTVLVEPPPVAPLVFAPDPLAPPGAAPVEPRTGPGAVVAPEAVRVLGRNVLPDSEDYYPADRRRLGIEGGATVRVCVDAHGARSGEPLIEESSRDMQLDAAALNVARHGRYTRAEQGGVAVPNCYRFHIVFRQTTH